MATYQYRNEKTGQVVTVSACGDRYAINALAAARRPEIERQLEAGMILNSLTVGYEPDGNWVEFRSGNYTPDLNPTGKRVALRSKKVKAQVRYANEKSDIPNPFPGLKGWV